MQNILRKNCFSKTPNTLTKNFSRLYPLRTVSVGNYQPSFKGCIEHSPRYFSTPSAPSNSVPEKVASEPSTQPTNTKGFEEKYNFINKQTPKKGFPQEQSSNESLFADSPENQRYLENMSLTELIRSKFVYTCCTNQWLVSSSPKLIEFAKEFWFGWMSDAIVRKTFFKTFIAGENPEEIHKTMQKLENSNIHTILDLSIESDLDLGKLSQRSQNYLQENKIQNIKADKFLEEYLQSIDIASKFKNSFAAIKVTSLLPTESLFRLSTYYVHVVNGYYDAITNDPKSPLFSNKSISQSNFPTDLKINFDQFLTYVLAPIPQLNHLDFESKNETTQKIQTPADLAKQLFQSIDSDKDGLVDLVDIEIGMSLDNKKLRQLLVFTSENTLPESKKKAGSNENPSWIQKGELEDYDRLLERMNSLATRAKNLNVQLMIDAEHSYFQPTIDMATLSTMSRFNMQTLDKNSNDFTTYQTKPIIYNTYQMYTKTGLRRLAVDYKKSQTLGFSFAAKLVRGAYMYQERDLFLNSKNNKKKHYGNVGTSESAANSSQGPSVDIMHIMGYRESPINETIEDTHNSYNNGILYMMEMIAENQKKLDKLTSNNLINGKRLEVKNPALFIGSHNHNSIAFGIRKMHEFAISPESKTISFGQLLGMQDLVSHKLADLGMNEYKYVPYGPLDETLPYLIRRAQENSSILDTANQELVNINKELVKRLKKSFN
ncbi:hypothetical protein BB558_002757 [Smittium angustum]|uniref:Proline dehydrogenase n=1 Tax=Smittium angustum TaxID=133377 RepID=A0A2U1J7W5_SMIAN|nr:hypothetical protein BB558_002757 [Smittium angustum]